MTTKTKVKTPKKRANTYEKKLRINASFGGAIKALVSDTKPQSKKKK